MLSFSTTYFGVFTDNLSLPIQRYNERLTQRDPLDQLLRRFCKMLASRVLPPIRSSSPPSTPVATFFSVPRRYVKSSMQVGDDNLRSPIEDGTPGRSLRKSSRIQTPKTVPDSSSVQRTKVEEQPTPPSPRVARKRNTSLETDGNAEESVESESPTDVKTPASAVSTGSGELSPHVCLCQPEPKIPRPRNGEFVILCSLSRRLEPPRGVGGTARFGQPYL